MSDIQVVINDRAVRQMLDAAPGQITEALRLGTEDTTLYWQRIMKTYPPGRNGTAGPARQVSFTTRTGRSVNFMAGGYVRTGTLGRSWSMPDSRRVSLANDMITGRVSSHGFIAPYNRYVQDEELQARVHQGRWETMQAVAARTAGQVRTFYENRLRVLQR